MNNVWWFDNLIPYFAKFIYLEIMVFNKTQSQICNCSEMYSDQMVSVGHHVLNKGALIMGKIMDGKFVQYDT